MLRIFKLSLFALLAVSLPTFAGDKKADKKADTDSIPAVDVSDVKDKLVVLSDGKQHYLAVVPFANNIYTHLYYGDGKRFYAQLVSGGGSVGTTQWDRVFWEPRVSAPWQGAINFKDDKYAVQCGDRATDFTPLGADEQAKLLGSATFHKTLWTHRAYSLARDNKGTYYFVDRLREPEDNRSFRLFAGPRGNMKLLKMTNVVSDSQGDIFTTKKGELRLVLDRKHPSWFAGKAETELINLPLEDNRMLIYTDLGVYAGQRLGTPCDDLL
jgi:hypothetical protein